MNKIKILLVDDHKMIRAGIKTFLDENDLYEIIFEANNGIEALESYKNTRPDLVITDLMMPEMDGIELAEKIIEYDKDAKIIALTMLNENHHIKKMMKAGALGYVLKNCTEDQLNTAIETIMSGKKYYSAEVTDILMNDQPKTVALKSRLSLEVPLTKREVEVLQLICNEYSNQEISNELFIGMRTVDAHKRNLLEKTGCKNTAGLVVYAIERKLFGED